MNELKSFAALLPDIPRWVETRGLLLSGRGEVFAAENAAADFVVRALNGKLICVVAKPARHFIEGAIDKSSNAVEVLTVVENREHLASILMGWQQSPAVIHLLPETVRITLSNSAIIKVLQKPAIIRIYDQAPQLSEELQEALNFTEVAAVIAAEQPVSFCYAGAETETLWDISIDTLPDYRRRGYAEQCVKFMISHMGKRGRQPVWGAEESNIASLKLAEKLGFKPVDQVFLFKK